MPMAVTGCHWSFAESAGVSDDEAQDEGAPIPSKRSELEL